VADIIPFTSSGEALEEFYKIPPEEVAFIVFCISHPNGDFTIIEGEGACENSGLPLAHASAMRYYFQEIENDLLNEYFEEPE